MKRLIPATIGLLALATVAVPTALMTASASSTADGLVGYWPFNTASSGSSPELVNGYNATLNGGAAIGSPATGNVAHNTGSLSLNGTDAFASVAAQSDLGMTSAYTISTWANINSAPLADTKYQPIAFRAMTNSNDIEVYVQYGAGGHLIVAHNRGNGGTFQYASYPIPPLNTWFHLAVTYDGTNVTAYYNGVSQGSQAVVPPLYTVVGWWFGKVDHTDFGGQNLLLGGLDEMRLYNRALAQNEVSALANYDNFSIGLAPSTTIDPINSAQSFTATLTPPLSFIPVDFSVSGVNAPAPATVMSDGAGKSGFSYTGTVAGVDTVTSYVDADNNGVLDPSDPHAMATARWWFASHPFKSAGSGTETLLSAPGCQISPGDCTVQSNGTAISSHLGKGPYISTLTVHWGSATSNGAGGFCAPADGTGTLTAANGDTLTQVETGTVCEVGPTSLTAAHTFTGAFADTGGSGRFANATGGGTVTGGDDGLGHSHYSETGKIDY